MAWVEDRPPSAGCSRRPVAFENRVGNRCLPPAPVRFSTMKLLPEQFAPSAPP